jgi:hypothetical protein
MRSVILYSFIGVVAFAVRSALSIARASGATSRPAADSDASGSGRDKWIANLSDQSAYPKSNSHAISEILP